METLDYRYYLTEVIRLQAQGKTYAQSLYDMQHPKPEVDPSEVVADIISRAGLEVTDGPA